MTEAEEMKQRLEERQRERLRPFATGREVYSPRWFTLVITRLIDHNISTCCRLHVARGCRFLIALNVIIITYSNNNMLCGRPPRYAPAPCKLTFDLLTLKVVSESRVMWATSVPVLVFLGPMYATDRQTSDAHHRLMPGRGIITRPRRYL